MTALTDGERTRLTADFETLLDSTCEITNLAGSTFNADTGQYDLTVDVRNPTTGVFEEADASTDYAHPCWVRSGAGQERVVDVGGDLVTLRLYRVRLAVGVTGVEVDDVITIITSPDPEMVGKALRVRDFPADDLAVTRLALCEEQD